MIEFYRAHFIRDTDRERTVTVDLAINTTTRKRLDLFLSGGWWGGLDTRDVWPFVMRTRNRMDFGNSEDFPISDGERFATFEIDDVIIAKGDTYRCRYLFEDHNFKLVSLIPLSEAVAKYQD